MGHAVVVAWWDVAGTDSGWAWRTGVGDSGPLSCRARKIDSAALRRALCRECAVAVVDRGTDHERLVDRRARRP